MHDPALRPVSGILLAGGRSSRMGRSKAELVLEGQTLLERQTEKLRALGITDILLSGAACTPLPGARVIPDRFPDRGPLGGLHACLQAAKEAACLVLTVDAPLVPLSVLEELRLAHRGGVTVLRHGEKLEPLLGVYDADLHTTIAQMLEEGIGAVRALERRAPYRFFDYRGPEELLHNCNTPEEFAAAQALAARCRLQKVPLP